MATLNGTIGFKAPGQFIGLYTPSHELTRIFGKFTTIITIEGEPQKGDDILVLDRSVYCWNPETEQPNLSICTTQKRFRVVEITNIEFTLPETDVDQWSSSSTKELTPNPTGSGRLATLELEKD